MQTSWHYTTFLDALDHWQALAAGLVAILAALIAVLGPEFFARHKEQREIKALHASLAAEIRLYIDLLIKTHEILEMPSTRTQFFEMLGDYQGKQADLRNLAMLHSPIVYPAAASQLGSLSRPPATDVVEFYGIIERLNYTTRAMTSEPRNPVSPPGNYNVLVELFGDASVKSLPLLSQLPIHEGDADLIANIKRIDAADKHVSPGFRSKPWMPGS